MAWSAPLNLNIDYICSASNPTLDASTTPPRTWGSVYPCGINAGTIASVAILGSSVSVIVGLLIHFVMMRWAKGDEHTNWGMKMNKLAFLTRRGCFSLFTSFSIWTLLYGIFWFIGLLIVFSSRQRNDATDGIRISAGYLVALFFMLFGLYFVMINASEAFTRTARSAMNVGGVSGSLRSAYSHGVVTSFLGAGLAIFGAATYYLFMTLVRDRNAYANYGVLCSTNGVFCGQTLAWQQLTGYAWGISTMAILLRGMSGVFGKAAEVGSELIHKLEPEASNESSKNPASIADKTGAIAIDSVAMMVDIVDSLIITIVSAGFLAQGHAPRMAIPFWIAGASFLSGLIAYGFVRCSNAGVINVADRYRNMMWGLRIGMYLTAFLNLVWYAVIIGILYTGYPSRFGGPNSGWNFYACLVIGTVASLLVWEFTSYFTAAGSSPTRSVAAAGITGASTMLIQGSGVGLLSTLPMAIILIVTIISCGAISGQYGIALGALAYLCNCWFTISANSIAPVAYAADSCVDQPETAAVREVTVSLHMAGESCAAETRGWGTVGAILAAFAALAAFRQEVGLENVQQGGTESDVISEGIMFACAVFGAFTPFYVAGINVLAVGKATRALVDETRRQFQNIAGYTDCNPESVAKATAYPAAMGALLPSFIVLLLPLSIGFLIGGRALSCFAAGAVLSGGIMGYFLSNAGATWVKSKTSIEAEGAFAGSGSDAHIASVIGTRMGSALKDVAAPTMVTSIKTITMTALLMAPLIFIDRSQPYFMTCLAKRWASPGLSTLPCYDWNKAYWSPLPLFFLALIILLFYVVFWNRDSTPKPSAAPAYQAEAAPAQQQPMQQQQQQSMAPTQLQQPQPQAPPMMSQAVPIGITGQMPMVMGPLQSTFVQQPGFMPSSFPGEPIMAAPMAAPSLGVPPVYGGAQPEFKSVEHFMSSGYQVQPH